MKNVFFCEKNNFKIISVLLLYSTESPVEIITLKHEEIITLTIIKICKNAMVVSKPAMSSAKPAMSTFELPVFQNQHFPKIQPTQKHHLKRSKWLFFLVANSPYCVNQESIKK